METVTNWLTTQGLTLAQLVLKAVIILVIGILLIRIAGKIVEKMLEKSKLEKAAHTLIITLAKTVLWVLLLLVVASSLGIDVTGIVALASVVTLAISLSLQNMLSNVVGGFVLLYTHPFSSGDYVEIAGQSGSVTEIGMTYTKLHTPDNKEISIPNSAVVATQIINYTVLGKRRADVSISASYDTPAQQVIEALVSCADEAAILTDPEAPYAVLVSYDASVINYQLRFWVGVDDYWDTVFAVNQKIKTVFDAKGVKMSYPHLNVHMDK